MIVKERLKGFIAGVITATVISTVVFAEPAERMIKAVYNDIKIYVDGNLVKPTDATGNPVEPFGYNGTTYLPVRAVAQALGKTVEWDGNTNSVYIGKKPVTEMKEVRVENAQQLLDAIGSDRKIILKAGTYNLSKIIQGYTENKEVFWENVYDGNQLVLKDVHNLTLTTENNGIADILVEPRYANVINFRNVSNISIHGVKAGHTPERGECIGGVFVFENSKNINIEKSELFGCGTEGLRLTDVDTFKFADSVVTDCSYGIMTIQDSKNLEFANSKFVKNEQYHGINIDSSADILFDKCEISENKAGMAPLFNISLSQNVVLKNSQVLNNTSDSFTGDPSLIKLENNTFKNNSFGDVK